MATERAWASSPSARAERDGGAGERAQLLRAAFEDRGALHEVEHAEPGRETRRTRRRQHVVGAGDIIADRLRRVGADEDRAGIADARGEALGIGGGDFQMLGRDRVDQRHRLVERCGPGSQRRNRATRRRRPRCAAAVSTDPRLRAPTAAASAASSVIRIACALASCSACANRSAAIQSGLPVLSAMISTSDGPAIMSMPTLPNTTRLAAAT